MRLGCAARRVEPVSTDLGGGAVGAKERFSSTRTQWIFNTLDWLMSTVFRGGRQINMHTNIPPFFQI